MNGVGSYCGGLTENTSRGPSPMLWKDCPWDQIIRDGSKGIAFFDDFVDSFQDPTTAKIYGKYACLDTGDSTITATNVAGGGVQLLVTTDNEDVGIRLGTGSPFVISDTAAAAKKLWFECRVKKSSIANTSAGGVFIGLANEDALAANFIADAAADFADNDYLGFWFPEADGDDVGLVYGITGQAPTTPTGLDSLDVIVADTYVKLGFFYDPDAAAAKRIKLYVNGLEYTTGVSATNIATATFPDGEEMNLMFYASAGNGGDDFTATMDWWRIAQLV
jgi:hypothetical protein